jgi:diketogulonate reductase-like aldo/keto reductase
MPFHPIKLNDGRECPPIAFGSAKSPKDDQGCAVQVDQAIDVGFDHIDTAQSLSLAHLTGVVQSLSFS